MDKSTTLTRAHESTAANTFALVPEPPLVERAAGATLWDKAGREYIDMVCGSAVSNFGHGVAWQKEAVERVLRTGYLHTGTRLPSPFRAEFYSELAGILPAELDTFHLLNSGAEAVETALKAAQYVTGRSGVVSFYGGYHGRTTDDCALTHTIGLFSQGRGTRLGSQGYLRRHGAVHDFATCRCWPLAHVPGAGATWLPKQNF